MKEFRAVKGMGFFRIPFGDELRITFLRKKGGLRILYLYFAVGGIVFAVLCRQFGMLPKVFGGCDG